MFTAFARTLGFNSQQGATLLAGYSLSSAAGRLIFGLLSDRVLGPLNSLFLVSALPALETNGLMLRSRYLSFQSQIMICISILVVWNLSSALAPLILFVILNGAATGLVAIYCSGFENLKSFFHQWLFFSLSASHSIIVHKYSCTNDNQSCCHVKSIQYFISTQD